MCSVRDTSSPQPPFLDLISNAEARGFWGHYIREKRVAAEEFTEAFEGWLVNGGVSDVDCEVILQHSKQTLDRQRAGVVSYGEFNKFTLGLVPFTPPNVRHVIRAIPQP